MALLGGVADPAFRREHLSGLSLLVPLTDMFGWLLGIVTPQKKEERKKKLLGMVWEDLIPPACTPASSTAFTDQPVAIYARCHDASISGRGIATAALQQLWLGRPE